ncbi:ATP-binding protein [Streptomyces sp. NPDC000594]|uniref:ATP-binding protein n=1 Tax=Streptomyces sp. NPDC000594 TaxID=3154261 RepID=UPI00331F2632
MRLSLPFARRSARRERDNAPPAVRVTRGWRLRLRSRSWGSALAGAAVPTGAWAAGAAGAVAWPWTAAGAAAAGTGVVLLGARLARGDAAKIVAERAGESAALREAERQRDAARAAASAWTDRYRAVIAEGRTALYTALGHPAPPAHAADADPFRAVDRALTTVLSETAAAVEQLGREAGADREAEVVLSVAPRLHGTISQLLDVLEVLEHRIEDPELLRVVFRAELYATLARRYCESLMVLGGENFAGSREPVPLGTVVRQASAETMHHRRAAVKPLPPEGVWLVGYAGPAVTHLLSAVMDNALYFSPTDTGVEIRAERCPEGLRIEIEDHGLGMGADALAAENGLLADPQPRTVLNRLRDNKVGHAVVARLASKYSIAVELRAKAAPEHGVVASVVLPAELLLTRSQLPPAARPPRPRPVLASTPPAAPPVPAGPRADGGSRPGLPRRAAAAPTAQEPDPAPAPEVAGARPLLPRRTRRTGTASSSSSSGPDRATAAATPSPTFAGAFFTGARQPAGEPAPQGASDTGDGAVPQPQS